MELNKMNTQDSIETRLKVRSAIVINKKSSLKQIFGDLDEWVFQEGIFKFLLNPINRRWLFWDHVHNQWEDTGHYSGEVKFVWDGNKLLTPKASDNIANPAREADAMMISVDSPAHEYPVFANTLISNERNSDIKIEDTESKALIIQHAGGFSFFAIDKKAEILVNGNIVPQGGTLLHEKDKITLGKTEFNFKIFPKPEEAKITETEDKITKTKSEQTKIKQKHTPKLQCSNCHAELYEGQKFCTACGRKVDTQSSKEFCPNCGAEIKKGQKFCTTCGEKL